jgi:hypothetical protein
MYFFKASYLYLYLACSWLVSCLAVFAIAQGDWLWIGPLLVWLPLQLVNLWRRNKSTIFDRDEREKLPMTLAMLGVCLLLVTGQRDAILWSTLGGLFGLLLFVFPMSALGRGLREPAVDLSAIKDLKWIDQHNQTRHFSELTIDQSVIVVVLHSLASVYSKMVVRELLEVITLPNSLIKPTQIVVISTIKNSKELSLLSTAGVNCWFDVQDNSLATLGLWLRGGNWFFRSEPHAARPALVVLNSDKAEPVFWSVAKNFRLPPSLRENLPKINRLL